MGHTLKTISFHLYYNPGTMDSWNQPCVRSEALPARTFPTHVPTHYRASSSISLYTTILDPAARAARFWPESATITVLQTLSHAVQSIPVLAPALYAGRRVLQRALHAEVTCGFRSRGCDPIRTEPHRVQLLEPVSSCCSPFPVSGLLDRYRRWLCK